MANCPTAKSLTANNLRAIYRNGIGGGIKVFYLDHVSVSTIDKFSDCDGSVESISLKANIPGFGKFVIGSIYRPPNKSVPDFLCQLNNILSSLGSCRTLILI